MNKTISTDQNHKYKEHINLTLKWVRNGDAGACPGTHFLSSSLCASALHSGQRSSRRYSIMHFLSRLCSSLVSFSEGRRSRSGLHPNAPPFWRRHAHPPRPPTSQRPPDHLQSLHTFPQTLQDHEVELHLQEVETDATLQTVLKHQTRTGTRTVFKQLLH